jgi:hypothetical protein
LSSRASARILAIDAGRLLATSGIVWVHVSEVQGLSARAAALGRFGTSFYIVAAVFMTALPFFGRARRSAREIVSLRARRLLIPFVLWSAIYAAFYLGTMLPQGYALTDIVSLWGPLAGTAPHLWFLPFAFLASALTAGLMPRLLALQQRTLTLALVACVLLTYSATYGVLLPTLDHGGLARLSLVRLGRYIEEAPLALSALFGVALYGKHREKLGRLGAPRRRRLGALLGLAFLLTQLAYFFALEPLRHLFWTEVRLFANLAGCLLLSLCLAWRKDAVISWLSRFGRATYFAFLVHQLLLDLIKVPLAGVPGHGGLALALITTAGVFGVSLALGVWVPKVPGLRALVP